MIDADVSGEARRVLSVLRARCADGPARAVPDRTLAVEAGVPRRDVIELARELAAMDVAVLASCGVRGQRGAKGRYIERDPQRVAEYAERLHRRARCIHGRAAEYSDLAARMKQRGMVEPDGQRRLFAEVAG